MLGFNYKKAVQILNYFAKNEGGQINKMKALKLIWLADRLHIRKYGRPIVNDVYFAMRFGPVPSNTKDLIEASEFLSDEELSYRNNFIELIDQQQRFYKSINNIDANVFSKSDCECIKNVALQFAKKEPFQLSDISHHYPEWTKFESMLNNGESSRFQMEYEDFFGNPINSNDSIFEEEEGLLDLAKEIYLENKYIAQAL
ncbi:Panacea domain-containing protein [Haliscomenobacter sp.]|uniref:Panacea domain-containing protein n=1 Tax=Haliscomenobacter sp. TaxID=2717303 RepID=UPI003364E378